jgi:transcriptional regulator with XRE-family HTH domain
MEPQTFRPNEKMALQLGMPKKSKLELTPVSFGDDTLGLRLARIRKERGFTQVALAQRTGLTQVLVSDYERGRIRLSAEMAVRFAEALGISTDELLRPSKKAAVSATQPPSLKILRRMERIESLPLYRQRALLTTIDQFLAAADR